MVTAISLMVVFTAGFWQLTAMQHDTGIQADTVSGMGVYVSEGCIHCHSQYSRPVGKDEELWGPATPVPASAAAPVLIGNRRQGPDLSSIGLRRSREWNRQHLIEPDSVVTGSRMPSYRHLFENGNQQKGEALLDYLSSLESGDFEKWMLRISSWEPEGSLFSGDPLIGQDAYLMNCAQCHGINGTGSGPLSSAFSKQPRNLVSDAFLYAPDNMGPENQARRLAQIIKYGQPGTSMPGHETLSDKEIIDLLAYLFKIRKN